MAGRRRRGLTTEDRQVWEQVAATATPLRPQPTIQATVTPPVPPAPELRRPSAPVAQPPRVTIGPAPDPHAALDRAHPHMDRRRFDKLRRGRMDPQARIDLHGMSSERAHAVLTGFILDAHAADLRLVLVITGKGRVEDAAIGPRRHGILRHSLPHWLAMPPLNARILQVTPAHQRHGGAGAFYVYLRRRR